MWKISNIALLFLLLAATYSSYLEFPLIRRTFDKKNYKHDPVVCKNQTTLSQDAEYKEICYEKDISYSIPFINNDQHVFMSIDMTTPISWIKSPNCKIEGTNSKCRRIVETFAEKTAEFKKSIAKKFHKKQNEEQVENAIIEGSSQIIRGEIQKSKDISFIAKDSSRLNNFFELIMLGLFIYGEKDHLKLDTTSFINATFLSSNLNQLSDGAISLRFDQTSENSFLNQIFSYVKATEKTITIYLNQSSFITVGDLTAKYTQSGFSSIQWIEMPEDEGFGKLPQLSGIGFEDSKQDTEDETEQIITAVLSLSSSYIGLPQNVITTLFNKNQPKDVKCTVNSKTYFVECKSNNKKNLEKLIEKNIFFTFKGKNIMVPLSILVLQKSSKGLVLNIKKTFNSRAILGEPIFYQNLIVLDYSKNQFGFAPKRIQFNQFFIDVVSLIHFLCFIFVIGCCFILCYQPCRKMLRAISSKNWMQKVEGTEGRKLRQYSPIQENPYEDLKGKIQEVISSTENEATEGV